MWPWKIKEKLTYFVASQVEEREAALRTRIPAFWHLPRMLVVLRVFRDVTEVAVQLWCLLNCEALTNRLLRLLSPSERCVAPDDVIPHLERKEDLQCRVDGANTRKQRRHVTLQQTPTHDTSRNQSAQDGWLRIEPVLDSAWADCLHRTDSNAPTRVVVASWTGRRVPVKQSQLHSVQIRECDGVGERMSNLKLRERSLCSSRALLLHQRPLQKSHTLHAPITRLPQNVLQPQNIGLTSRGRGHHSWQVRTTHVDVGLNLLTNYVSMSFAHFPMLKPVRPVHVIATCEWVTSYVAGATNRRPSSSVCSVAVTTVLEDVFSEKLISSRTVSSSSLTTNGNLVGDVTSVEKNAWATYQQFSCDVLKLTDRFDQALRLSSPLATSADSTPSVGSEFACP